VERLSLAARIVVVNLTPEIRRVLEWLADVSEADELPDPPFDMALLENWFVRAPDGETTEVSPPLVDFDTETAEWR
jgi:hypothetical protein